MSKLKYARILQAVAALPWAILPAKLATIHSLLAFQADGGKLTAEEVKAVMEAGGPAASRRQSQQGVAVLPLVGTIVPRGNMFSESSGAVSVQRFTNAFRQAMADPDVGHIIIDVDSPGGQVGGVAELADEIYQARGVKPVTAVANHLMASAAYWIGAAAEELVMTPSAQVGSIGVFAIHEDYSQALEKEGISVSLISAGAFKTEGNPYQPLDDEARLAMQKTVDDYYDMFVASVAHSRGVGADSVRNGFGQGRVLTADDAVNEFMVDRVATLDEVVSDSLVNLSNPARALASAEADLEFRRRRLRAVGR